MELATTAFAIAPAFVYRGQADSDWPVRSSLDRLEAKFPQRKNLSGKNPPYFRRPPLTEKEHMAAFKRAMRGRLGLGVEGLPDDEWWAIGQHHGLATPLTDWTRSPFVALFFAFEEALRLDRDGRMSEPVHRVVYALSTSALPKRGIPKADAVQFVSPSTNTNYRLVGQAALLLKLPRRTDLETYVRKHFRGEEHSQILTKIEIANVDRDGCLVALNKMNINRMSLFPDADGAARYVNSLWEPGHEDSLAYV
jgi:hypothetical protein